MFKRPASYSTVGTGRPVRRGAFALEPIEALPRLAERIGRLAGRALEPNPFFLPEFLAPAIRALGGRRLRLATYTDRDDLRFFAPVTLRSGLIGGARLEVWIHPFAPLGAPLIDAEDPDPVCEDVMRHLVESGRNLLAIPHLPLEGPAATCLRRAAERRGVCAVAGVAMRPILTPHGDANADGFLRLMSGKRRKEMDRQLRHLARIGAVSFATARTPTEMEAAFGAFVVLEESGWKGRRGTSLNRNSRVLEFARTAVARLALRGVASIDVLRVGDRPAAALIRFDQDGLSIPWKIAYDETLAAYSPGKQLMANLTRRWLRDDRVSRVDPVCEPGNALLANLWSDAEPYGTLVLATARSGTAARWRAGLIDVKFAARRQARALLQRGPAIRKSKAAPAAARSGARLEGPARRA